MPPEQANSQREEELQEPLLVYHRESHHDERAEEPSVDNRDIRIPYLAFGKELRLNLNVFLNLAISVFYGLSDSLCNGTAFAAYLKKLSHNENAPLGDIEAVYGLASLFSALPVGYLADRIGRSHVIRAGGILMFSVNIMQIFLLEWIGTDETSITDSHKRTGLIILGVIMALSGIAGGTVNGPAAALFADSTPEGKRSIYYTYSYSCYTLAAAVGPLVSIILFQTIGDEWGLYHLRIVIYVGLGFAVLYSILMLFFDDAKALDESSRPENQEAVQLEAGDDGDEEARAAAVLTAEITALQRRQRWIPWIIFIQGLISAIGSGMTVKFFPLFFKDEVGMTPSQVQVIYVTSPIMIVICSALISKLASYGFGRVQATLLFSSLGVGLLFSMVFFKSYLDGHPIVLVPIYILRTALMNCSYPLQESILMDFVPKQERARWMSLDSVASFGWCGSAAFGGWLSDKYDYTYTFLITAIIQGVGVAVWALLLPLVPRKEGHHAHDDAHDSPSDGGWISNHNQNIQHTQRHRNDDAIVSNEPCHEIRQSSDFQTEDL